MDIGKVNKFVIHGSLNNYHKHETYLVVHKYLLALVNRVIIGPKFRRTIPGLEIRHLNLSVHSQSLCPTALARRMQYIGIYRVSQEECVRLRKDVPYVKVCRYNPKQLCPKLNGYGENGQKKCGLLAGPRTVHVS
jgi:hypothetical protein